MTKQGKKVERMVRIALWMLFTIHCSLFTFKASAQGLPLIRNYTAAEYGGHNRCYDIAIGDDGTVFVANFEGLLYYDRSRWRIIHTSDISRITVVYRADDNTIWVGGYSFFARVQKHPNGELYMERVGKAGLFEGEVLEIFEDNGSLEFVVSDNNLYEVKRAARQAPDIVRKQHLNTNFNINIDANVISVDALKEGSGEVLLEDITVTAALDGGLQVKVKKDQGLIIADSLGHDLYTITEANGLCSNQVAYVAYDGHGVLWGATLHGIFSIELPSVYSYFLPKDGLAGEVQAFAPFDGKMYVGGTNGLFAVQAYHLRHIPEISNICWTLCQYRDRLLAGTSSGIYRIARGGAVERMTSTAVTAMFVDGDKIYAGEPDGLWAYDEAGRRQRINDLPHVMQIGKDARGRLWCRNVNGERRWIGEAASSAGETPAYHESDAGVVADGREAPLKDLPDYLLRPVGGFEMTAHYRYGSQVWIGGDEIVVSIATDKRHLTRLSECRTIRFRSVIMGSDSVLWGGYGDMPARLPELGSDEGNLHFYYALDYTPLSGHTLYRYRLNNNQWSAWSERQDVEFLNLSYGSYTLSVQAQLAGGELSEVASIGFSVAPPLPMRWYMRLVYLLLLVYIVYLLFRYRLKRLEREKVKLEQIVEERTADLRTAQHELIRQEKMATVGKLTEGLVDRILNPMNYIINFSKMSNNLLKDLREDIELNQDGFDKDDYDDAQDVLGMLGENLQSVERYGQNTTRILKAMEEMLKDRTGGYTDMDLLPVLQQCEQMLGSYFAKEKEQYRLSTVFALPAGAMPLHGNPTLLSKTVMGLLGNAVYAVVKKAQKQQAPAADYQPEITLTATSDDTHYTLKVRDNGTGIEEKSIDKIFDPFFTTKTTDEAAGVGLYLSREIIQNHGGDIGVASVKDEYTEFTITLPKQQTK